MSKLTAIKKDIFREEINWPQTIAVTGLAAFAIYGFTTSAADEDRPSVATRDLAAMRAVSTGAAVLLATRVFNLFVEK